MFSMTEAKFEKLTKLTGPIKVTESMHKAVKALAKRFNRKDQDQIRELIKLGLEKTKEGEAPTYTKDDLEKIVGILVEEKMSRYTPPATEGPPKKASNTKR